MPGQWDLLSSETTREMSMTSGNVKVTFLFVSEEGHPADASVLRDVIAPCTPRQAFSWNVPVWLDAEIPFIINKQ